MKAGRVVGRVVATKKIESLEGVKLLLLQPVGWDRSPQGDPIVAADAVGAGAGEFVFWVAAREAAVGMGGTGLKDTPPIDAAILGIIDGVDFEAGSGKS